MEISSKNNEKRTKLSDFQTSHVLSASQVEEQQQEIDRQLTKLVDSSEIATKALLHNKFGTFMIKAQYYDKAEFHFNKALELVKEGLPIRFSNIYMNLANCFGQTKELNKAIEYYRLVISTSPFNNNEEDNTKEDNQEIKLFEFSPRLNSYEAFVDAHINLGVLYSNTGNHDQGFEFCQKAIKLSPDNKEAIINFGDLLRQIGKKDYAIQYTWDMIKRDIDQNNNNKGFQAFQIPKKINVQEVNKIMKSTQKGEENCEESQCKNIVCVKWGTRYDAEYVNKLYRGIKKNTKQNFNFYCFTEDPKGLDPNIIPKELLENWTRWWGKATLFSSMNGLVGQVFYIDLDMIVTGNIDKILNYETSFGILKTDYLACEQNHKDGFNSSIMIWNSEYLNPVFDVLKENFSSITKFIVRFDFWLEMMIENADFLQDQDTFKGEIVDYLNECQEKLPQNSRIVCFPRKPKPEDYPSEWIKEYWI